MRRSVLLALLGLVAVLPQAAAAASKPLAAATADVRFQGPAVPKSFLGFSQEYNIVESETGRIDHPLNPVLVKLYDNLAASGAGQPVLRMGGNTQDSAWWNPARGPRPRDVQLDLTPEFFRSVERFLSASGAKVIVGLNMAVNRPEIPVAVAEAAQTILKPGQIMSFEVGNEPHVYPFRTQGLDESGKEYHTRPKDYDHDDYLPELETHVDALNTVSPKPPLSAPGYCCEPWLTDLPVLLRRNARDLAQVALHRYPLESCGLKPGTKKYPNAATLLRQEVLLGNIRPLAPAVKQARRYKLGVRLTETNSVTCGGAVATSDRMAAALWAQDWLFSLAAIGLEGVNFHASSPLYQPFHTRRFQGRYLAQVKPLYYGMLAFSEAIPNRSRLLPTTYFASRVRKGNNVKIWGAVDKKEKVVRVVAIHKGGKSGTVEIKVPFAKGTGRLKRLRAPGMLANANITWGGQGFPNPTYDGALVGDEKTEKVRRRRGSVFRFRLPKASSAMLEVKVGRTRARRIIK